MTFAFATDTATVAEIERHLRVCDAHFHPPLSARTAISRYACKIVSSARRFEAWSDARLVGLVAAYMDRGSEGFVTSVSVVEEMRGRGIARMLLRRCIDAARHAGIVTLRLEVDPRAVEAVALYEGAGFVPLPGPAGTLVLDVARLSRNRGT